MLNIIGKKNLYFLITLLVIIPGVISLCLWGLNLSIDFTGGSRMTLLFPRAVNEQTVANVKAIFQQEKVEVVTTQTSGKTIIVRTKPLNEKEDAKVIAALKKQVGKFK